MVRWLLFDVGGVLERVDDARWPVRFAERCAARVGLRVEELTRRLDAAELPDTTVRSGVEAEYWTAFAAAIDADGETLAAIRADFWDAYCGSANTVLLAEARALRGRVGLAILSNSGDGAREEEERRYGFAALFDPVCYSHELGVRKPDPAAFTAALTAMRAEPADVLLLDDLPANVAAARALGIRAHLHVDDATTLAAIRRGLEGTRGIHGEPA
ncbi:MAG: HAD-IA family hydrolase [Amnibacterium sp.]